MFIESIRIEYQRYKELGEGTFRQVPPDRFFEKPGVENNSLSILISHISGNLKSRFTDFLTSDGEKDWRNRDKEFEQENLSREKLMEIWEEGWSVLFATLQSLSDEDMDKIVRIRGKELTVVKALHRSLAHTAYHVGQIVQLGKYFAGERWQTLSIARNQSASYNQNPDKER